MFLHTLLLITCSQLPSPPEAPLKSDELKVTPRAGSVSLTWRDTEDVIRGELTPNPVRADEPISLSVDVGSLDGVEMTGPVTVSLRPAPKSNQPRENLGPVSLDSMKSAAIQTATRKPGAPGYVFQITPVSDGPNVIEVSFRTTRLKVARGVLQVAPSKFSPLLWGVITASIIGLGLLLVLSRMKSRNAAAASPPETHAHPPT